MLFNFEKYPEIGAIMNTKKGDITPLGVAVAVMLAGGCEYTTNTDKRKAKPEKAPYMVKVMRAANIAVYDKDGKRIFDIYNRARNIRVYGLPAVMEKFPESLITIKADGGRDKATDGPKPLTYSVYVDAVNVEKAVKKLLPLCKWEKAEKAPAKEKPAKGNKPAAPKKEKATDKPAAVKEKASPAPVEKPAPATVETTAPAAK